MENVNDLLLLLFLLADVGPTHVEHFEAVSFSPEDTLTSAMDSELMQTCVYWTTQYLHNKT